MESQSEARELCSQPIREQRNQMILSERAKKYGSRDRDSGCPKQGVQLSMFFKDKL